MKALLALASVLIPSLTAPAIPHVQIVSPDAIVQVVCLTTPTTLSLGTAFRVGPGLYLSVNHVTNEPNCSIGGKAVRVTYKSPSADFSMLTGDPGPSLKIDCGGFIAGHHYLAIGFARGLPFQTTVELQATGQSDSGFAILTGIFTVVPGQSGGPIVDAETGAVVGTVNVYNFEKGMSGSVALKDTPVCAGRIA